MALAFDLKVLEMLALDAQMLWLELARELQTNAFQHFIARYFEFKLA